MGKNISKLGGKNEEKGRNKLGKSFGREWNMEKNSTNVGKGGNIFCKIYGKNWKKGGKNVGKKIEEKSDESPTQLALKSLTDNRQISKMLWGPL